MRARTPGIMPLVTLLLVCEMVGISVGQEDTTARPAVSVAGELAFSETLVFDYDRDGVQERVQFWISFEAVPPPGGPDAADPETESGSLVYYVYDLESEQLVDDWMVGFNMTMGGGFPRAGESYPLTNVRITGRTAQFDLAGTTFTIVDNGDSWDEDTIEITNQNGTRPARFYGGDVRVVANPLEVTRPMDIAANRECNECHEDAGISIAVLGGEHRELECRECHTVHPPDVDGAVFPDCLACHDGHAETMTASTCTECHASHDVTHYAHSPTIADESCAACHEDVVETLADSQSLHMGIGCVLCHQDEHAAEAKACQHCHRGTHPQHVMRKPELCGDCHGSAHDLKSAHEGH